ncbi:S8 family serine peptidase [Paenibacillus zanthoxyli]|uniref:S8 family serine peptidase n=1 Tax=Paenibacillus zanthoxyli TaxID=369399 RepID=UPI000472E628|nr:S8 family serine peptidase [Paenibacillus zanthoxyli]
MPDEIDICIIDDGINEDIFNIGALKYNKEITENLLITTNRKHYDQHLLSHGTVCAGIIKKNAPAAKLSSVKILQKREKIDGSVHQLIKALYWCAENNIRIVNLSLGTTYFRDFADVTYCINEVTERGLIVIAACNNNKLFTLPACLTNVIGVKSSEALMPNQYIFNPYPADGIEVITSGRQTIPRINGENFETRNSNSFAASFITSMVYQILRRKPNLGVEGIKKELYDYSEGDNKEDYNPYLTISTDWIKQNTVLDITNLSQRGNHIGTILTNASTLNLNSISFVEGDNLIDGQERLKIWNSAFYEECINAWLDQQETEIELPIPVLSINGLPGTNILLRLNELFHKDGYYSKLISDNSKYAIHNFEYLPNGVNYVDFFLFVYKKYNCDLIIFSSEKPSECYSLNRQLFDIVVRFTYPTKSDSLQVDYRAVAIINGKSLKGKIERIYKYIRKVLTS